MMADIYTFPFRREDFDQLKDFKYGMNWPVVYVSEDEKEVYIGETTNLLSRSRQHYENPDKRRLKTIHVITDDEFNKSAALDVESWLIQYMSADQKYLLQNGNGGLRNHNYYDREKYKAKFEIIWEKLLAEKLAIHSLHELKNSDLFKYSPYKCLTEDQMLTAYSIVDDLEAKKSHTYIVNGKPGTGKTILAIYLFKYLQENTKTKNLKVGLVVPMRSLRKTVKKVFGNVKGLKSSMVIGPNDVVKQHYNVLIVDEAHRLRRRKNITNYAAFDNINSQLSLSEEGHELDWILKSSDSQILFYDENQSIRPSDVRPEIFSNLDAKFYELSSQMRVKGGEEYISFIDNLLDLQPVSRSAFKEYDFKVYEDVRVMLNDIKKKNTTHGLCRMVAGYAWPWHTKLGKKNRTQDYDIEIGDLKLIWNTKAQDWVNSPNSIDEVGCIHTVQGYDLNYVGVIIGEELKYNKAENRLEVDKEKYFDRNGHAGVHDPAELERYIVNIYKTLLTRGILGTFVYIVDEDLREYFKQALS